MVVRFVVATAAFLALAGSASAQTVRIAEKPEKLVQGTLNVTVVATDPVVRIALLINSVPFSSGPGKKITFQVPIGQYIRRLRVRAVGYDESGANAGEDEMVVNDPRPPFRVRLQGPSTLPESGNVMLSASVIKPGSLRVSAVDFFVGEEKIATANAEPYVAWFDAKHYGQAVYSRVVARSTDGQEANSVHFFGSQPRDEIDVSLQQIPVSTMSGDKPLKLEELTLFDNGEERRIESLVAASDQPLYLVLLIDYSESMLEELPVVKAAAKQFAQKVLRPQDRIAVIGFNQRMFWLTGFTNDWNAAAAAVDRVKPAGETHLYDTLIEVLFELQKQPGRQALVVLTDAVDQGSKFKLDHVVHYARYAGVPVYPIIKNKALTRLMRFGVGYLQRRRIADLADDTGASYFIIQKESELAGVYARIAQELRQQYQLIFYSAPGSLDSWHILRLETKGEQRVRVPRGYFP